MSLYLSISLICLVSGALSGLMGFGALIIMVPALVFLLGISTTIPLGVLCGISTQGLNAFTYRKHIKKDALLQMLLGSLPGIWLGSTLLCELPEYLLRAALGAFIICYVLWSIFSKLPPVTRPPASRWVYIAGFFSGALGGAFGVNGPPAVMYAARAGWTPPAIRAFLGMFCGLLFVFIAIMQSARGLIGPEVWGFAVLAIPCCLVGSLCGQRVATRLRAEQYIRLVFILLFIMGLLLCWPALRMFLAGFTASA